MAEALLEHIWAMAGVFAVFVAVVFGIRGARFSRGYGTEQHTHESS
ncbi:MAG: hypothetical protein QXU32_13105 [Nitrososphaerales archaeon]